MERVTNWIKSGDITTFFFLNRSLKNSIADRIMLFITMFGSALWSMILMFVFLLSRNSILEKAGIHLGISLSLSHIIVQIGKKLLRRRRPYQSLENVLTCSKLYKDYSFPSGHSAASFCIATVLSCVVPGYSVIFYVFALLVAVSRVYLGMHYPSDTIIGSIIGVVTALLI